MWPGKHCMTILLHVFRLFSFLTLPVSVQLPPSAFWWPERCIPLISCKFLQSCLFSLPCLGSEPPCTRCQLRLSFWLENLDPVINARKLRGILLYKWRGTGGILHPSFIIIFYNALDKYVRGLYCNWRTEFSLNLPYLSRNSQQRPKRWDQ